MYDAEVAERVVGHRNETFEEGERWEKHGRAALLVVSRPCWLCCILAGIYSVPHSPSAAGWSNTAGTVSDPNTRSSNPPEDIDHLPPLEELFGDLQGDDYIERLEELAESLLREVTAEVETNPCRTNEQVSVKEDTAKKRDHPEGVVGPTPENVEASRACGGLSDNYQPWHPVASSTISSTPCTRSNATTPMSIKSEVEVKQEVDTHDLDTVYGTYDESTNSITIIYPGEENGVGIQECVQEVSTDGVCSTEDSAYFTPNCYYSNNQFSPTYTCTDTMSPSSIHSEDMDSGFTRTKLDSSASDCGYESHDSPAPDSRNEKGNLALADLWHESFSELFPTLA